MNQQGKLSKIIIIIFCVAAIVAVSFLKMKDGNSQKGSLITSGHIETSNNVKKVVPNSTIPKEESLDQYLASDQMEKMDISLYAEEATDDYVPEGMVNQTFIIMNQDKVSDLPEWALKVLPEQMQKHINLNLPDEIETKEVIIQNDIVKESEMYRFSCDLNNGYICTVNIDLNNKEILFGNHQKEDLQ